MKWLRLAIIFFILSLLYIQLPKAFPEFDTPILSLYFNLRGPVTADSNVVVAAINDASILEYGDWPWSRSKIAEIVDSISVSKPAAVVVNIFFRKNSRKNSNSSNFEEDSVRIAIESKILSQSFRNAGNIVLPYNFEKLEDNAGVTAIELPPQKIRNTRIEKTGAPGHASDIIPAAIIHDPEPDIMESAALLGFNNHINSSRTGRSRFTLQSVRFGSEYYPSIALLAASIRLGSGFALRSGESVIFDNGHALPMDDLGTSMINFYGPARTFTHYSASEIFSRNFNREALRGKIVVLGLTDKKNSDPQRTPFANSLSSSELWANIIANSLPDNPGFFRFSSLLLTLILPLLCMAGLALLTEFLLYRNLKSALPVTAGLLGALLLLGFLLFVNGYWFSVFVPALYLLGLCVFLVVRYVRRGNAAAVAGPNPLGTAIFNAQGTLVRIGRYQVAGCLGSGSMGTVYKCVDPKINRTVAVKTLKMGTDLGEHKEMLERFSREAHAAGSINHNNIVTIYDFGEANDLSYIVMEYLEGDSLEQRLARDKRLSPAETVRIMKQIADGLSRAHDEGVIHRDLKPSNIMLLKDTGKVKIMDFGVAKVASATLTQTGKTVGTPFYMSPEQLNGEPLDGRSDLFALGVMAFEMLAGRRPFGGENLSALTYAILHKPHPDVREFNPDLPPSATALFNKALSKDPAGRYGKAVEFARALEDSLIKN